ncbi:MAG: hypothetical protein COA42_10900 [Alteromonadaceae bacterium]|nr:MAG: hypothetical protein COA42_10900 [Alteromonadaceae bacterium]
MGHLRAFTSECADNIVTDYLVNNIMPEKNTVCDPGSTPFGAGLPVYEPLSRLDRKAWFR